MGPAAAMISEMMTMTMMIEFLIIAVLLILFLYLAVGGVLWFKNRYVISFQKRITIDDWNRNPGGTAYVLNTFDQREQDIMAAEQEQYSAMIANNARSVLQKRQQIR